MGFNDFNPRNSIFFVHEHEKGFITSGSVYSATETSQSLELSGIQSLSLR